MSALTEFTVPADALALERSFRRAPALRVELARTVACDENLSFLWSSGVPASNATAVLEADAAVESATPLSEETAEARRALYSVEWNDDPIAALEPLATAGSLLEVTAAGGRWHITTVHPDHESLTAAYKACDAPVDVRSVRERELPQPDHMLTESQHETLVSALEHNFYGIPRDVTLSDLANELGVSHQAVSERLRRSHRKLAMQAIEESNRSERTG